jgi:endoglucanase
MRAAMRFGSTFGRISFCAGLAACAASLTACLIPKTSMQSAEGQAALAESHNLLLASNFDNGRSVPWSSSFTAPGTGEVGVQDGALCLRIDDKGVNVWDAQIRHREMVIERGREYTVRFRAWASAPTHARPKVGMAGPPYAEYWADTIELGPEPRTFGAVFTMKAKDDPTAEFAFHLGGDMATTVPLTVCIDDISLSDPEFQRAVTTEASASAPRLLVNQLGYLPKRAKLATLVSDSAEPVAFQLLDAQGQVLGEGMSLPFGADKASGKSVHTIDFSSFAGEGNGLILVAAGEKSHPFTVGAGVYKALKYDALAYFYHNRSGIDITMPYAGDERWTRRAGPDDKQVGCAPGAGCNYTLDVSGGWYDAGDHGKYVVNGGISAWTLFNQYERLTQVGKSKSNFDDGRMSIPEQKNGVPDLLDEARWELDFLLRMQVKDGPQAGLVHHKMHDAAWTALPLRPDQDKQKRQLYAPSTAATLNLAATAAQAARIFKGLDAAYAQRCLAAAEKAYAAAQKHPDLFAKVGGVGGGPYDDNHLSDEFYWAAAELWITTGNASYREAVTKSPYYRKVSTSGEGGSGGLASFTWQNTESLGTLSLALVGGAAGAAEQSAARDAVKQAADVYVQTRTSQGFHVPLEPGADNSLAWGSNGSVLNNMMVLALAYDFSNDPRYADAVVSGMDYILGENPLDQCYVTGYGARPLRNPHHRFWAHQIDASFPPPPPGAVSGGPNSSLQDPYAQGYGLKGCAPQTCFVDHIESFSTNEITINWNAPLAWTAAFLDELGQRGL